ncbi:hypothetical protein DMH12_24855 [Streptomyces sp. WAC 04229]|uniref:hypothetical protein n=1 Tax=Streptomyces sp. WAC 04229 TaxID=2203206 RepID=UPI000F736629|nr:hypothetical protein [Streptomyces sp. WAC 04229]RSN50515.1 hypothetical protein DMH12_24855 [Streptomyces sp. WAC 04229]
MAKPTATPLSRSVELQLSGHPDVKNKYGSGHIRPARVVFHYLTDRATARLYGVWVREDGELTDAPIDQDYREDVSWWPDWLAALAREHQPAGVQPRRGDEFEAWLKAQRDKYDRHGESSEFWHEFDSALDRYRLHADMGVPLGGHVCEAKVVGDCECLEQQDA